jgi:hypothetical protein
VLVHLLRLIGHRRSPGNTTQGLVRRGSRIAEPTLKSRCVLFPTLRGLKNECRGFHTQGMKPSLEKGEANRPHGILGGPSACTPAIEAACSSHEPSDSPKTRRSQGGLWDPVYISESILLCPNPLAARARPEPRPTRAQPRPPGNEERSPCHPNALLARRSAYPL